jgi:phosphotransferase system HPr-like phosphotransfer protein
MKREMIISLHSIDGVKDFVNMVSKIDGDVTISSGRYIIDAKSIMGIFSLDLSKTVTLEIEEWKDEYMEMLKQYIAV